MAVPSARPKMHGWIVVLEEGSPPGVDSGEEGLKSRGLSVQGMHRTSCPIHHLLQQVAAGVEEECLVDQSALGLTWGQAIHALAQCNDKDHTHHRHRKMAPSGEGAVEELWVHLWKLYQNRSSSGVEMEEAEEPP